MNNTKITEEELTSLQSIIEQYETVSFKIGQFTIDIENAKNERKEMINHAEHLLQERSTILSSFEQKYGSDIKVNIQTGEITKNG